MTTDSAREALIELMDELSEHIYTNSAVREAVEQLYAIASNLLDFFDLDDPDANAWPLQNVLHDIASSPAGRGMKRMLRHAASLAEDLEEYGDRSRYEGLDDTELDSADEVRAALHEILEAFFTKVGILSEQC